MNGVADLILAAAELRVTRRANYMAVSRDGDSRSPQASPTKPTASKTRRDANSDELILRDCADGGGGIFHSLSVLQVITKNKRSSGNNSTACTHIAHERIAHDACAVGDVYP